MTPNGTTLDMDLIRRMLVAWGANEDLEKTLSGDRDPSDFAFHFRVIRDSPLAEVALRQDDGQPITYRLSERGREFLPVAHDEARWAVFRDRVLQSTGDLAGTGEAGVKLAVYAIDSYSEMAVMGV